MAEIDNVTVKVDAVITDEHYRVVMGAVMAANECIDLLVAENAKLRELCRRFSEYVSHDRCEGCVVKRRCNDGEVYECWQMGEIRKLAHELRVEVEW